MPRFVVETTEPFDNDLRAAASWRLTNVGLSSAARFLDAYDALVAAIGEFPLMAGSVEGTRALRCRMRRRRGRAHGHAHATLPHVC